MLLLQVHPRLCQAPLRTCHSISNRAADFKTSDISLGRAVSMATVTQRKYFLKFKSLAQGFWVLSLHRDIYTAENYKRMMELCFDEAKALGVTEVLARLRM